MRRFLCVVMAGMMAIGCLCTGVGAADEINLTSEENKLTEVAIMRATGNMDSAFSLPCSHLSRRKLIYVFFLGLTVVFFIVFLMDIQFHSAKSVIRTVGLSPEKVQTCGAVLIKTESSTNAQVGVAFDAETQNEFLDYLKATQCTIAEESPSTPVSDYRYYVYFEENNGKTLTVFFTSNGYMSFKGNSYKLNMPGGENLIDFLSNHV